MDLQADAVAEAVAEVPGVARCVDQRARGGVGVAPAHARAHRVEPGLLRAQDQLVDLARPLAGLADRIRARAVRAVAVELRAPVDRHEAAGRDLRLARDRVRERAVRAVRDDRVEARALCAEPAHLLLERERDGALAAAREAVLERALQRRVGQLGGRTDLRDLLRILDGAQLLDAAARGDQLDARRQRLAQAVERAHRHVLVLDPEPHVAGGQRGDRVLQQVLLADPPLEAVHLLLGLGYVAEVRDEAAQVAHADERDAVGARVAGEVADVDEVRHEQRVDLALVEQRDEAVGARHELSSSRSSASASR